MSAERPIRFALPKGRMQSGVFALFADSGIALREGARNYRPELSISGFEVKLLKPQSIVEMLHHGSRDLGFAGADWVAELSANLVELFDTGLDPVRLVAAAPETLLENGSLPKRRLTIASEYVRLSKAWAEREGISADVVRSFGATEVYPPEDADFIVDNTATGSTLKANGLAIVADLMKSSTRLYAHPKTMEDPARRNRIEDLVMLLKSVIEARRRVMVEVNVAADKLEAVIAVLPCMREPTIAQLHGEGGYAVRAAVPRKDLPSVIVEIKRRGGTDIVVTNLSQLVP
ncbi:MAG: ATP phosphoribosyltransferase [Polyangiaceae bacterium]|nr:ATP phosphoribosyltransferase [Polyangiaceae bacterium]